MEEIQTNPGYRKDIDGLRGVAVLLVVMYHAFPTYFKYGFIGVDIFFIISGFVISRKIANDLNNEKFEIYRFYSSRIKRIFPSLIVVMLSTLAFGLYLMLSNEYKQLGKHVIGGSIFADNFFYLGESGYFDNESKRKPLLHLWSLGIEFQFYILWPFFLMKVRKKSIIIFLSAILLFISFLFRVYHYSNNASQAFYSTHTRIWEFLIGCIFYFSYIESNKKSSVLTDNVFSLIGVAGLLYSFYIIDNGEKVSHLLLIISMIGTGIIIGSGDNSFIGKTILSSKIIVWFGLISYPLYLWHWPLLSYAKIITSSTDPSRNVRAGLVAASVVLAWLTHIYVENPARYWQKTSRINIVHHLVVLMIFTSFLGMLAYNGTISPRFNSSDNEIILAADEWTYPEKEFSLIKYNDMQLVSRKLDNKKQVVYFGDSTIQQYSARINRIMTENKEQSKSSLFFTRGGCPPIDDISYVGESPINCSGFVDNFFNYIDENKNEIESIVLGAVWYTAFKKSSQYRTIGNNDENIDLVYKNFEKTIDDIKKYNFKIYIVLQPPYHEKLNPLNIINRTSLNRNNERICIKKDFFNQGEIGSIRRKIIEISTKKGINIIDPMDQLCNNECCPATNLENKVIYRDSYHLRPSYIEKNLSFLDETILSFN